MSSKKKAKVETPRKNWIGLALFGIVLVGMILFFTFSKPAAALVPTATMAAAAPVVETVAPDQVDGQLPDEVSVSDTVEMQKAGAFILDVREPDEWAAGHIDGATLIPLGQLAKRANELPTDQDIVVVCRSGRRSAQGRDILLQTGLKDVTSMSGGMNAWAGAGNPVVTGE